MRALILTALLVAPPAFSQTRSTLLSPSPQSGGRFGTSVTIVPDADGDGTDDLAVGTFEQLDPATTVREGRVYVFSGATNALIHTLESPTPGSASSFGAAVAGLEDVTGDGRGDLLVGHTGPGRVLVYDGSMGVLVGSIDTPGGTDAGFGNALAALSDGTVLVGAPNEDVPGPGGATVADAGRAYRFKLSSGGTSATLIGAYTSSKPEFRGGFGAALAGVPDATGDGRVDVAISARLETVEGVASSGRVYLYDGDTNALFGVLTSPVGGEVFGWSLAGVGDTDGDGLGELLIGVPLAFVPDGSGGTVDVAGRADLVGADDGELVATLVSPNPEEFGQFGRSATAADVTGDGSPDLFVGTYSQDESGRVSQFTVGGVHVQTFTPPPGDPVGDVRFGQAVAAFGNRLIVGAPQTNTSGLADAGAAYHYVYPPATTASATLAGAEGWRLLAAPVDALLFDVFAGIRTQGAVGASAGADGDPNVFRYEESAAGDRNVGYVPIADLTASATPGRGYAVYVFEDDDPFTPGTQGGFPKSLSATGGTRSGTDVELPVSNTGPTTEDGWNLVGNPFTQSLDWDHPDWVRTNVDNTIYVYDAVAGEYKTWNGTTGSLGNGVIAPFQGFWVTANGAPTLVAPAAAETSGPPPVGAVTASRLALSVEGNAGGVAVSDQAFVAFVEGASDAVDGYDAYELAPFRSSFARLFAEVNGVALDIDARPVWNGGAEVSLGAALVAGGTSAGGTLTLRWPDLSTVPASWGLTLSDAVTGAVVDLRTADSYTFSVEPGSGLAAAPQAEAFPLPRPLFDAPASVGQRASRFTLRFTGAVVATEESGESVSGIASVRPNPIASRSVVDVRHKETGSARLVVVDVLGREVAVLHEGSLPRGAHTFTFDSRGLSAGAYVLVWSTSGGVDVRTLTVSR
ncbi:MAG TPA: hypothetical protein EYQ24_09570 [Bacteroidetes bacterium]|nr:hypothetical protein [Bacteroidota bacterium]HIL57199.1 hypothetical protein [Rhodothermales bacterium]